MKIDVLQNCNASKDISFSLKLTMTAVIDCRYVRRKLNVTFFRFRRCEWQRRCRCSPWRGRGCARRQELQNCYLAPVPAQSYARYRRLGWKDCGLSTPHLPTLRRLF